MILHEIAFLFKILFEMIKNIKNISRNETKRR